PGTPGAAWSAPIFRFSADLFDWARSVDRAGELLAGALAGLVGVGAGLPERALEALQAVLDDPGLGPEMLGGPGHQTGECGDELACLVEIQSRARRGVVVGEPQLLGRGAHENDDRAEDDLLRGDISQVDDLDLTGVEVPLEQVLGAGLV